MAKQTTLSAKKTGKNTEVRRVGRFSVIGVMNTVIDFSVYNLLQTFLHFPPYPSNLVSTSCAMVFSFLMNKHVVFRDKGLGWSSQAAKFVITTAFGLWGIQSTVVLILTTGLHLGQLNLHVTAPITAGLAIAHALGINHILSDSFMSRNGAKVYGILFSATWDYLMYRNFVFRNWSDKK